MTVTHLEILLRLLTAVVLGGLIGYERGRTDHPAGLRTHILVALASATFMLVSTQLAFLQHYDQSELLRKATLGQLVHVDTSRIASGVVMGMGFLGAGSILRTGLNVHGLTTAACLWMVSAVGLSAGCGMYVTAVASTFFALAVLVGLGLIEQRFRRRTKRLLTIVLDSTGPGRVELLALVDGASHELGRVDYEHSLKAGRSRLFVEIDFDRASDADALYARLEALKGVIRVKMHSPKM